MKKLLLVITTALILCACSGEKTKKTEPEKKNEVSVTSEAGKDKEGSSGTEAAEPSEEKKTEELSVSGLAEAILKDGGFEGELTALPEAAVSNFFTVDEGAESVVYFGNNGNQETLAVFAKTDTGKLKESVNTYLNDKKEEAKLYNPEEVPKLESAIIKEKDGFVIFCISKDAAKAGSLIEDLFK